MMYYVLISALVLIDQASKYYIRSSMQLGDSIPVIDGVFHITYISNTGAAFSMLEGMKWLLIAVPAVLIVIFLFLLVKNRKTCHWTMLTALTFIISGGVGNMIDRISLDGVTDFLDFRIWPVFNAADIFVCIGCALLAVYIIFIEGKTQKGD